MNYQNQLRLTTQVSNVIEFCTNKDTTCVRNVYIGKQKVSLRRARTKITAANVDVLSFLELMDVVALNDSMKELVENVQEKRKPHVNCRSAKEGIDMNVLLQQIVDQVGYKQDHETVTAKILFE